MQKMQRELEEAKSAVTILELSKQDEIESVSRQYTQELASMQSIMKGRRLVQLTHLEIQLSDYVPRKVSGTLLFSCASAKAERSLSSLSCMCV